MAVAEYRGGLYIIGGFDENGNAVSTVEEIVPPSIPAGVKENSNLPFGYKLSQNYPNPFNPSTKIEYQVANAGLVSLKVYDVLGKEIATLINEVKSAGSYEVNFNAAGLASGIYFYRLQTKRSDFEKSLHGKKQGASSTGQ